MCEPDSMRTLRVTIYATLKLEGQGFASFCLGETNVSPLGFNLIVVSPLGFKKG